MNKAEIRKNILEKRNSMCSTEKEEKDNKIIKNLISTQLYKKSNNIFIYVSYGSEVDTKKIISKAISDGKKVFVPKIKDDLSSMEAVNIESLQDLVPGRYGILEPVNFELQISKENLDIIIMPGVVFDKAGNRIGYGGGYYDRYLSTIAYKNNKVALAYDFQVIENIQVEEHDIKADYIVTDSSLI